jgi:UTP--glucose-1-phosphate uridylyltransferase
LTKFKAISEVPIQKVVLPAAGLGTRLLSATKEQPKEMLPVFTKDTNGNLALKPILQLVFEQLYDSGFHDFCFIVGKEKRAIEDHFTPDYDYLESLGNRGKGPQVASLSAFYDKITNSSIIWVNQHLPLGFGHAVLRAKAFVGEEPFLVHAGDTYIISNNQNHLHALMAEYRKTDADALLLLQNVEDPKQYGVAEVRKDGSSLVVRRVEEKPEHPKTKLAILPIYIFKQSIFRALRLISPDKVGEIQLTDAIQKLIDMKLNVRAIMLGRESLRLDIGTPESYWEAQQLSYEYCFTKNLLKKF